MAAVLPQLCPGGGGACRQGPRSCPMVRRSSPVELWDQNQVGQYRKGAQMLLRPTANCLSHRRPHPTTQVGKLRLKKKSHPMSQGQSWQQPHKLHSSEWPWLTYEVSTPAPQPGAGWLEHGLRSGSPLILPKLWLRQLEQLLDRPGHGRENFLHSPDANPSWAPAGAWLPTPTAGRGDVCPHPGAPSEGASLLVEADQVAPTAPPSPGRSPSSCLILLTSLSLPPSHAVCGGTAWEGVGW